MSGIGIHELASIDLAGIKGMWPLRLGQDATLDNTLVLSFVEQTRVLTLTGEEVEETEIPGFIAEQQTFYTGNTDTGHIVQVTPGSVVLVCPVSCQRVDTWSPPGGKLISGIIQEVQSLQAQMINHILYYKGLYNIIHCVVILMLYLTVCGCNSSQILVASGNILFYIEISREGKTLIFPYLSPSW